MPEAKDFLDELRWRGLLKDVTDEPGLREHLRTGPRRIYAGFDPSADSLTIGNLIPITVLAHARRAGHEAVVVMGGGTGLIGDPSGKSAERMLLTAETVASHVECHRPIFDAVLGAFEGPPYEVVNNADWLTGLGYIDVLRDVGKHFSVNDMIRAESVRARLEEREQGISYTEFSYMILQAYDFLHLLRERGVTVQCGGSDQYGNILAGLRLISKARGATTCDLVEYVQSEFESYGLESIQLKRAPSFGLKPVGDSDIAALSEIADHVADLRELMRKLIDSGGIDGAEFPTEILDRLTSQYHRSAWLETTESFGFVAPLVTKADGGKFGKTESGAVWLTAARTSPYAYHQFWLNASDDDVGPPHPDGRGGWLRKFTFLPREEIESIEREHAAAPGKRLAQRTLAREATRLLHGEEEMTQAEAAGRALFSGEIAGLPEATLRDVFGEVPSSEHAKAALAGEGADLVELLVETGLARSKREAREFIAKGSVSVNGAQAAEGRRVTADDLLHASMIALRRGKKAWHVTRWA